MAAGYLFHIAQNHPFVDGNKRVGAMAAELFLVVNAQRLEAPDEALVELAFAVARGEVSAEALAIWIRQRSRPE